MTTVQWMIKNDHNDCNVQSDPSYPPIVTIRKTGAGSTATYSALYAGYAVTDIVVVFLAGVQEEDDDDPTYRFLLNFETEDAEPDPLLIDEARFESLGTTVTDARCTWTIVNGSAREKGRITVAVFNHDVQGGEVKWTLDSGTGSPGASLSLKVKRQDAAISCP